jgi:ubiquinone/menaquinone biosynthesis C-methylase UbiE
MTADPAAPSRFSMSPGAMTKETTISFNEHYASTMQRMFAAVSDLYAEYWNDFFHFAIFPKGNESWDDAFAFTHAKYVKALDIPNACKVLELACGRGGFSKIMAQHTKGTVLGIDISGSQLSHAKRHEGKNLSFKQHDVMKVDQLGETFDAVAYMDAACYLPDKAKAVSAISRVVKKGGRLLLIDWCKQEGLSRVQEELVLQPFMDYWAVPSLETAAGYRRHLKKAGFRILAEEDLNDRTRPNWDFGYDSALKAVKELSFRDVPRLLWKGMKLGPEGLRLIKEQFPSALYIKTGFDAGFLRYVYFVAEKI